MAQLFVIAGVLAVLCRDMLGPPVFSPSGWAPAGVTLGPMALTLAYAWRSCRTARRRMLELDTWAPASRADRAVFRARAAAGVSTVLGVLVGGWLDWVRLRVGDRVLVDEALALAPLVLAMGLGWAFLAPVDRLIREAVLLQRVDDGGADGPIGEGSAGGYAVRQLRHHVLIVLAPALLVLAWGESAERLLPGGWVGPAQLLGIGLVMALSPLLVRVVWPTSALPAGPVRDRLETLCRASGVRVSDLLVWHTGQTVLNGAVVGLLRPLRYVLLTDALLRALPARQVEAVVAHELGHIRRGHMAWLVLVMAAVVGWGGVGGTLLAGATLGGADPDGWFGLVTLVGSLAGSAVVFGWVSRRFEWQADAFAVARLSEHRDRDAEPVPPDAGGPGTITPEAVASMRAALRLVSALNGIPIAQNSFRHGSIGLRQRRLGELVGADPARLGIDRVVRRIKLAGGAAFVGFLALVAYELARHALAV